MSGELRSGVKQKPYSRRWYKDGVLHLQEIKLFRPHFNNINHKKLIRLLNRIFKEPINKKYYGLLN